MNTAELRPVIDAFAENLMEFAALINRELPFPRAQREAVASFADEIGAGGLDAMIDNGTLPESVRGRDTVELIADLIEAITD